MQDFGISRRQMLQQGALSLVSSTLAHESLAQSGQKGRTRLSQLIQETAEQKRLPALWGAIALEGRVIGASAYGLRKNGDPTPVAVDDKLMIGSVSKPITSLLIAQLIERGLLSLESPLTEFIPELKATLHSRFGDVRLKNLLTHTSGVRPHPRNLPAASPSVEDRKKDRLAWVLDAFQAEPEGMTGKEFHYSNVGITATVVMAERATHTSYEQLLKKYVVHPLKLSSFGMGNPNPKEDTSQPWPHFITDITSKPQVQVRPQGINAYLAACPAGGIHLSVSDLARFGSALARGELVSKETRNLFFRVHPVGRTYSTMYREEYRGGFNLAHGGATGRGESTFLRVFPDWGAAIAIYSNSQIDGNGDEHYLLNMYLEALLAEMMVDLMRKYGHAKNSCSIRLTNVVSANAKREAYTPQKGDRDVNALVSLQVSGNPTGPLAMCVTCGNEKVWLFLFNGLEVGNFTFDFALSEPWKSGVRFLIDLDVAGTSGNIAPQDSRYETKTL